MTDHSKNPEFEKTVWMDEREEVFEYLIATQP